MAENDPSGPLLLYEKDTREVLVFPTVAELVKHIEAPDIDNYAVYDTQGNVLELSLDKPITVGLFGMLSNAKILVAQTERNKATQLRDAIAFDLQRAGHRVSDDATLSDLVMQQVLHARTKRRR